MFNFLRSIRWNRDLSVDFSRRIFDSRDDCTVMKSIPGRFHVWIFLKEIFGFSQHQENATIRLNYRLSMEKEKK